MNGRRAKRKREERDLEFGNSLGLENPGIVQKIYRKRVIREREVGEKREKKLGGN